jgi:hypothetical protein
MVLWLFMSTKRGPSSRFLPIFDRLCQKQKPFPTVVMALKGRARSNGRAVVAALRSAARGADGVVHRS